MAKRTRAGRRRDAAPSPLEVSREVLASAGRGIPVYLLYGEEQFMVDKTAAGLIERLIPEDERDFGLQVLSGADIPISAIVEALSGLPLFNRSKVVHLRRCGLFPGTRREGRKAAAGGGRKREWTRAGVVLEHLPAEGGGVTVIITEAGVDRRTALFKAVAERGVAAEFTPFAENDRHLGILYDYLSERLRGDGVAMSKGDFFHLVEIVGTDMRRILTETEKCALAAGPGKRIGRDLIDELAVPTREMAAWQLAEAVAAGEKSRSMELLRRLIGQGEHPLRILAALQTRFRLLLQARSLIDEGLIGAPAAIRSYPAFKRALEAVPARLKGLMSGRKNRNILAAHPFAAFKAYQTASRMTRESLSRRLDMTVRADTELKGKRLSAVQALEDLIFSLAS